MKSETDSTKGGGIGQSLVRNISVLFSAQVVTWGSSFVLLYFLPRYLGSVDFGRLYLALSIRMMLGLLIDFGGNYMISKEVARSRKEGMTILNSYIILRILLWIFSIGLVVLISNLLGYSEHVYWLILILAVGKLWEGAYSAISSYFQGIERMEYPSVGLISEKLFVALFAIIALLMGADSITVAIIMTAGALLNLIVLYSFSRKRIKIDYRFNFRVFGLFRSGMPYFLFSLFSIIYYRIDAVMISAYTNESVTGWYGGAFRFFDIVMVFPLIYKTAVFPVFSKLWDNKEGKLEHTVSESMRLMIILGIPVALLIYVYSEAIIQFFMGLDEYGPSVLILQIFAISIPFVYVDIILGSALLSAANRQKSWATIGLFAIFVNIGINAVLIPYFQVRYGNGGIGAAIATLFTEVFMMVSALVLLPKGYLQGFRGAYLFKPVGASLVMMLLVAGLLYLNFYWLLAIAMATIAYVIGLFLLNAFSKPEIELLKQYLSVSQIKKVLRLSKASY